MSKSPVQSRVALVKLFEENGGVLTDNQVGKFSNDPKIDFGGGTTIEEVLQHWIKLGRVVRDLESEKWFYE